MTAWEGFPTSQKWEYAIKLTRASDGTSWYQRGYYDQLMTWGSWDQAERWMHKNWPQSKRKYRLLEVEVVKVFIEEETSERKDRVGLTV